MEATHAYQTQTWRRWNEWWVKLGLNNDMFLDSFTSAQRIKLPEAFAMALHQEWFLSEANESLDEGTIKSSISYAAKTFKENDCLNPTKDKKSLEDFHQDFSEVSKMKIQNQLNKKP